MKIYNNVIIGSGYAAIGFAKAAVGTLILEEHQICDTQFYLPLTSFTYNHYEPMYDSGRMLYSTFVENGLFLADMQNTNGFECGLCEYLQKEPVDILLKCRVISIQETDAFAPNVCFDVRAQTNEGIVHFITHRVIDARPGSIKRSYTVLYVTQNPSEDAEVLCAAFPGAYVEPAFYDGRYAIHIPADNTDENLVKLGIYRKWNDIATEAKIVYMAPVFCCDGGAELSDQFYDNPIAAFEAGYRRGKELA